MWFKIVSRSAASCSFTSAPVCSLRTSLMTTLHNPNFSSLPQLHSVIRLRHDGFLLLPVSATSVTFVRTFSSKKRSSSASGKGDIDEVALDVERFQSALDSAFENLRTDFAKNLSVRTSPNVFDELPVKLPDDGGELPLSHLAKVTLPTPRTAVINLANNPVAVKPVATAINESGLNVNAQVDGTKIYVPLPMVTREHRENLAKNAKELCNKHIVILRKICDKFIRSLPPDQGSAGVSSNNVFAAKRFILAAQQEEKTKYEKLTKAKQTELMTEVK